MQRGRQHPQARHLHANQGMQRKDTALCAHYLQSAMVRAELWTESVCISPSHLRRRQGTQTKGARPPGCYLRTWPGRLCSCLPYVRSMLHRACLPAQAGPVNTSECSAATIRLDDTVRTAFD